MTLGAIAATGGVNVIELARSLDVIIKPSPECGVCGNETGQYEKEGQARAQRIPHSEPQVKSCNMK